MTEIELLEMIVLQLSDMQTSQAVQMMELQVRIDAVSGYIHWLGAGVAVLVGLTAFAIGFGRR